jgi:hypothetical protein
MLIKVAKRKIINENDLAAKRKNKRKYWPWNENLLTTWIIRIELTIDWIK